jgi:hypothetical protein
MAHASDHSPNAPTDYAPELSATDAQAGAKRGLYRVLLISILLALVVISLVWLGMGGLSPYEASQQTTPGGQLASGVSQQS